MNAKVTKWNLVSFALAAATTALGADVCSTGTNGSRCRTERYATF